MFETPVLFMIYNRPDVTMKVFSEIRKIKPKFLFLAADGPASDDPKEANNCNICRKFVMDNIDWDCKIKTLFRDENLGCKLSVSSAIDWFFDEVDQGIILEDDCLPSKSFFYFCESLLKKYEHRDEILVISGNNFNKKKVGEADYYFSKIPQIWGWATWKRVWRELDLEMSTYKDEIVRRSFSNKKVQNYWIDTFNLYKNRRIDTWDYSLTFLVFLKNGLCVCPNKNLVSNIGFGINSTNTLFSYNIEKILSIKEEINLPLKHPYKIEYNFDNDRGVLKYLLRFYGIKIFLKKIYLFNLVKKIAIFIYTIKKSFYE